MKYYEDLQALTEAERKAPFDFVVAAIEDYKRSDMYNDALIAYDYFRKRNVTIMKYQKILFTLSGEAVPNNYSANFKFINAFFPKFVKQENAFLLGDGVTFNHDATKNALGGDDFDGQLYAAGEAALWGACAYMFFNLDHVDVFNALEFVPLVSVEDGALHAGIRFWCIDKNHPLTAVLYEEDGYTKIIYPIDDKPRILQEKRPYKLNISESEADGAEIQSGENYPSFPIVPLWGNKEHQTELTGLREKIDGYDLIQSGFANDLDDASMIYWIVSGAEDMDEKDLTKFLNQIKRVKAAVINEENAKAEAHTVDIPYEAREAGLSNLRDSLYDDAMALDTKKITAGNITATAINSAYENLDLKCDGFEYCVTDAIKALMKLIDVEDSPTYHRRKTTNQAEVTSMVLSAAEYLDDETVLKKLPFINIDEVEDILIKKDKEEAGRFDDVEDGYDGQGEK